jgi:hypothetical protein
MTEFKIESIKDLNDIMIMARGGNPEAQQALNDFLDLSDNIERSNLPTRRDVQMISFLDFAGKTIFPDNDDDVFTSAATSIAKAFMAKGGEKSKQFVEMLKQTPSLSDLEQIQNKGTSLRERIFGSGGSE